MDVEITLPLIAAAGSGAVLIATAMVFGMRKIILMGQFSYHNARLSTLGNPYVTREELLPILDIKDTRSMIKSIQGDLSFQEEVVSFREADRSLMSSFHSSVDETERNSPKVIRPLVKAFINLWEVEELKRLIRLVGRRTEPLYPVGYLGSDLEKQFLLSQNLQQAIEVLEGLRVNKAIAPLVKETEISLEEIDSVLDRFALDELFNTDGLPFSCRKGSKAIAHLMADRYNIQLIIRSKETRWSRDGILSHLYTSGGTIGIPLLEQMVDSSSIRESISVLNGTHLEPFFKDALDKGQSAMEISLDKMLLEGSIGLAHSFASNVGPTIRYLISKEMELKNLRTMIQASFAGWSPTRTKSGLIMEGAPQ